MEELEFSQLDIPVSLSVWPGSDEARMMTAISGRKYLGLLTNSGRVGLCVKTLLVTSQWGSTLCFLTWKPRATPAGRLLFQLAPRMPRTGETESGLLQTPTASDAGKMGSLEDWNEYKEEGRTTHCRLRNQIHSLLPTPTANKTTPQSVDPEDIVQSSGEAWEVGTKPHSRLTGQPIQTNLADAARLLPTPRANDAEKRGNIDPTNPRNGLPGFVKMLPTPMTTDAKNNGGPGMMERNTPQLNAVAAMLATPTAALANGPGKRGTASENLNVQTGGKLNADFVEAMMGFPVGWTLIKSGKRRPSHTKRGKKPGRVKE